MLRAESHDGLLPRPSYAVNCRDALKEITLAHRLRTCLAKRIDIHALGGRGDSLSCHFSKLVGKCSSCHLLDWDGLFLLEKRAKKAMVDDGQRNNHRHLFVVSDSTTKG